MADFDPGTGLGPRLRLVRASRRLSVRELARRVGCSASLISQIERGVSVPSVGVLYSLATELGGSLGIVYVIDVRLRRAARLPPHSNGVGSAFQCRATASNQAMISSGVRTSGAFCRFELWRTLVIGFFSVHSHLIA